MEDLYLRSIEQLRAPVEMRPGRPSGSHLPAAGRGSAARGALRIVGGALVRAGQAAIRAAERAERSAAHDATAAP